MSKVSTIQNPSNIDTNQESSFFESLKNSTLFRNLVRTALLIAPITCLSGCPDESRLTEERQSPSAEDQVSNQRKSSARKSISSQGIIDLQDIVNNPNKYKIDTSGLKEALEEETLVEEALIKEALEEEALREALEDPLEDPERQ